MELMLRWRQLQTISSAVKERVGSAPDAQDLHLDGVSVLIPLEPGGAGWTSWFSKGAIGTACMSRGYGVFFNTFHAGSRGDGENACLHFNVGRTAGFRFLHSMMLRSGSVGNLSWLAKWPPRRGRCGSDRKGPMHVRRVVPGIRWTASSKKKSSAPSTPRGCNDCNRANFQILIFCFSPRLVVWESTWPHLTAAVDSSRLTELKVCAVHVDIGRNHRLGADSVF